MMLLNYCYKIHYNKVWSLEYCHKTSMASQIAVLGKQSIDECSIRKIIFFHATLHTCVTYLFLD